MTTEIRNYSWEYKGNNDIVIYEQCKEDENTYNCISHIIEQLKQENKNFMFHLKKTTEQRGGGYINEVSVAKSRAIKTPLHLYSEWNTKVNKCNSLEKIQTLLKKDKNN